MTTTNTTDEQLDDSHGFFQFAAFTDSEDDGDDGLFNATRDRTVAFDAEAINYTPRIDEDRWYDASSDSLSVGEWLSQHGGLDEITYTAQRMYFAKEYGRACSLCKQTVVEFVTSKQHKGEGNRRKNEVLRVATLREILEIGAKSAIRIGDLESVRFFYDWYLQCGGKNPGYNYFLAEVLTALGRHEEALAQYVEYLSERRQDAIVWELLGKTIVSLYSTSSTTGGEYSSVVAAHGIMWLRLALGAFYRSHSMIVACKNWKDMPVAVNRKRLQEDGLQKSVASTLDILFARQQSTQRADGSGLCNSSVVWDTCIKESIKPGNNDQAAFLDSCHTQELRSSVEWIVNRLASDKDKDMTADDEDDDCSGGENVAEL
ncbi:hypothetical protein H4S06_003423 [Coemansia sp. BCRC 34490]|nr:hypothetical protein H4S06_003423 [Coemansia sp. BCRC 34490]